MIDTQKLRARWAEDQPQYLALATHVMGILESETHAQGIKSTVSFRVKDSDSLVKKVLTKRLKGDESYDYDRLTDRAGARVVVRYPEHVTNICSIIDARFDVRERLDKSDDLDPDRLGYLGHHRIVSLRSEDLSGESTKFSGLVCEIQVNTQAQRLWADLDHDLVYKGIGNDVVQAKRMIYRLMALIEIFDDEVTRAKSLIESDPAFRDSVVLSVLESAFFSICDKPFNRDLSLEVVGHLLPTLTDLEITDYSTIVKNFVDEHAEKLADIYTDYEADDRFNVLVFQPESLMIFERLEADPYQLKDQWVERLPLAMLEQMAAAWGKGI